MTPRYILALDQGTTSSRAILYDHRSQVVAMMQEPLRQIYPKPGWVEHDPFDLWAGQNSTAVGVLSKADVHPDEVAAIGLTNQRETTLVWEKSTGKPIYNAIVWQDRRTAELCSNLKDDGLESMIRARTGLILDPYFSATKLRWILDHVEGAQSKAENGDLLFGTVDSWLLWQLTGRKCHVTDTTNASRTLLLNLHTTDWDPDLLEVFNIPRCMLPEVKSSSEVYGAVAHHHFLAGTPISGIAGDQQAALFGQACFSAGMAKNTYGTGCFLLMHTGNQPVTSKNNLLTTVAWKLGSVTEYALEGSVFIGGAVVQWLRDELQLVRTAAEVDQLAASVEDSGGLFLVPAFSGLGAPHWDPYARGIAVGITRGTHRAHFCRAALESIAFQCAEVIACMEKDSGLKLKELRVDGGAAKSAPLLQFQADLLDVAVIRPRNVESTAIGAAYLAGLAVGFWENRAAIEKHWTEDQRYQRSRPQAEMNVLQVNWDRAVQRSKNWEA